MTQPAWNNWFVALSGTAKTAAELPYLAPCSAPDGVTKVTNDGEQYFKNNFGRLSDFTRNILQEETAAEMPVGEVAPNAAAFGYWIVECVDGEVPKIKGVKSATALAKYLSSAEGKDVYVFPFYGIALPVTQGPQRHLYLPDGVTALTIPTKGNAVEEIDSDSLRKSVEMQTDYYFGFDEMRMSVVFKEDKKSTARQVKAARNDDDFDD